VGSDLLEASAEAVSNTEWATILFVFVILGVVYRAPLMIMIPMITIGVSLSVAIGLLAAATQVDTWFAWSWWTFGVFKTTRIFVVVILFGAGTDFCLFLISRLRENISAGANSTSAVAESLVQVAPALVASALTTILGLGMMAFAEFGKLAHSGPAIGLALAVTLLACLSLTPALLAAFGSKLFWPTQFVLPEQISALGTESSQAAAPSLWDRLAEIVVRYPGRVMVASLLVLAPIAWHGVATTESCHIRLACRTG
jgi:RND superfamily putative drug exporter